MIITKGMIHVEAMFINETFLSDQESPSMLFSNSNRELYKDMVSSE